MDARYHQHNTIHIQLLCWRHPSPLFRTWHPFHLGNVSITWCQALKSWIILHFKVKTWASNHDRSTYWTFLPFHDCHATPRRSYAPLYTLSLFFIIYHGHRGNLDVYYYHTIDLLFLLSSPKLALIIDCAHRNNPFLYTSAASNHQAHQDFKPVGPAIMSVHDRRIIHHRNSCEPPMTSSHHTAIRSSTHRFIAAPLVGCDCLYKWLLVHFKLPSYELETHHTTVTGNSGRTPACRRVLSILFWRQCSLTAQVINLLIKMMGDHLID